MENVGNKLKMWVELRVTLIAHEKLPANEAKRCHY